MYDQLTLDRIEKMHPSIREQLKIDYLEINKRLPKGVRLRFSHTFRTNAEQDALFNQRPKVTNAKGGQSIHNYGLAFDIVILYDDDNNGTFERASWERDSHFMTVVKFFKAKGWKWGGDWTSFKDYPHFQKDYTWQELKKLSVFVNNGLKYPVL